MQKQWNLGKTRCAACKNTVFGRRGGLPSFWPCAPLPRFPASAKIVLMTAEEKSTLARFLDLAGDYVRDGYARKHEYCCFEADTPEEKTTLAAESEPETFSSLPLAYLVDEDDYDAKNEAAEPPDTVTGNTLENLTAAVNNCKACGLAETRKNAVPGEGAQNPLVMVIGEGPGADEDAAGRPFVGKAGQLLDRMLASIGLFRNKNCFIANMVKCRPPGNRDPWPEEIIACYPFLERQILFLKPKIILCAGRVSAQNLLKTSTGINALRGKFLELKIAGNVIPVLPTFHPSALLRDDNLRRPAWEDLKLLRARLASVNEEYASSLEKPDA